MVYGSSFRDATRCQVWEIIDFVLALDAVLDIIDMPSIWLQIILSGNSHHARPPQQAQTVQLGGHDVPFDNPGEQHPLRLYWEYLCYLFRRTDALDSDAVLAASYFDHLQVREAA